MAYSHETLDHFLNPRNVGSLDENSPRVGTAVVGEPKCGDVMKLQIEVGDDGRIVDVRFRVFGCGSAIAACSFASEWLKGKTVERSAELRDTHIAKELSLPPAKLHCSVLAQDAVKAAVEDWRKKNSRA